MKVSEEQFNHMQRLLADRLFADQKGYSHLERRRFVNASMRERRQQLFNRCLNEAERYIRTMNILPEVTA